MRSKSFRLSLVIIAACVAVLAGVVLFVQASHRQGRVVHGQRFAKALAQYIQDHRSRGEPLPPSVTLDTLVESHYLQPEDAKPFEGVRLVFHPQADETRPQSILAEAHLPDGLVLAVLADGSIQGVSPQGLEELRKEAGRQGAPTNGSQRVNSGTNPISPTAGTHP